MKINHEISGNGDRAIIIETAMGSCFAEWRPIIKPLTNKYTVFLYDRPGYGKSDEDGTPRSPKVIAKQLNEIIRAEIPGKKYLLIGHSIGGLYIQQYIRDYPEKIIGAVFLDPVTTEDFRFQNELTKREYTKAGFDKSKMINSTLFFGKMRMLKLFKPLFKKSIPFYYYKDYDIETQKDILSHLMQLKTYKAVKREYEFYQDQNLIKEQLFQKPFPSIPVRVLHHNSQIMIDEMKYFGGLSKEECEKADNLWLEVMNNHYKQLSEDYSFEIAQNSGHYIHLTDPKKLYETIDEIAKSSNT
jgi:pimeloyl-ACP methyl ester carboxylesterase